MVVGVTELESTVADAWREVLELADVAATGEFFELGGESLAAMRVCNRIGKAFGVRVPLRVLYERSHFADFVAGVGEIVHAGGAPR